MLKINSQADLDNFISIPDWADAFVRECYLLSPSYVHNKSRSLVAADALPAMKVLICTQDINCPGIEFIFTEIINFNFSFCFDLEPKGIYENGTILLSLQGNDYDFIRCKSMHYRMLDQECWGFKIKYGTEMLYDEAGFLDIKNM